MGALFLVHARDPDFADTALAAARRQFARHGFAAPAETRLGDWRLLHAAPILGGPEHLFERGDDLVAVAGTLLCDGKLGTGALEALLDGFQPGAPDWSRIGGQFAALVRKGGRTFLLTDFFAAFQLFNDTEKRLFSTSLLSAVEALPRVSFDPQGVYELAFNVAPLGDDTIFNELKTVGPRVMMELRPGGAVEHRLAKPLPETVARASLPERIAAHRARLEAVVAPHVERFGNHIHCPLSGGLDSRLVLAALRGAGAAPALYVYGGESDEDVRISQAIGRSEALDVRWFDKEGYRTLDPDAFAEQVERNFHEYDGLPNFGELFENGGNAAARNARHAGGALAVSGGCGEVFRNFFYLPSRRLSAAAVARAFFARYAPGDTTERFDERRFLRGMEEKILAALGRAGDRAPLPRAVIEQIYPRVRCRALFGREISCEARFGPYLMPFLDHRLVAEAMTLPLSLKNAGRFEAALLNAIDPGLARHPSAYGHDFAGPPDLRHRFGEWSTRARPIWLRRRSYALQRRLRPMADEHGGLLTPDYMKRVVDLDYPMMRRFFRTEAINDTGLMRRIANLEYFAQKLGTRLVS